MSDDYDDYVKIKAVDGGWVVDRFYYVDVPRRQPVPTTVTESRTILEVEHTVHVASTPERLVELLLEFAARTSSNDVTRGIVDES